MKGILSSRFCEPFKNVIMENVSSFQFDFWLLIIDWYLYTKKNVDKSHSEWNQACGINLLKNAKRLSPFWFSLFSVLYSAIPNVPFKIYVVSIEGE